MINIKEWAERVEKLIDEQTTESMIAWFNEYDSGLRSYVGQGDFEDLDIPVFRAQETLGKTPLAHISEQSKSSNVVVNDNCGTIYAMAA